MKTRTGFVSNSSSSSFVVAFPRMPEDAKDLKKMLWGDKETLEKYGKEISTDLAADIIWGDIQAQRPDLPVSEPQLDMWFEEYGWELLLAEESGLPRSQHCSYDEGLPRAQALGKGAKEKFMELCGDGVLMYFDYEDHGTTGSILEHGPTFQALPHIRINNH